MINDQNVFFEFLNESGYISTMSKYFNEFVIFLSVPVFCTL